MSNVTVVGGQSNGTQIKWFGNVVYIDGVKHSLYRVAYHSGFVQDFYAQKLGALDDVLDLSGVRSIGICK